MAKNHFLHAFLGPMCGKHMAKYHLARNAKNVGTWSTIELKWTNCQKITFCIHFFWTNVLENKWPNTTLPAMPKMLEHGPL
jgi:hypothetical protein